MIFLNEFTIYILVFFNVSYLFFIIFFETIYNLPSEISKKIFHYLNQKDIETCYFVCKNWYLVAIRLNREDVKLNNSKIGLVKSHLNDSNYCEYFKYGHLIKKLTVINRDSMLENIINDLVVEKIFGRLEKRNTPKDQYKFSKQEILLLLNQLQDKFHYWPPKSSIIYSFLFGVYPAI